VFVVVTHENIAAYDAQYKLMSYLRFLLIHQSFHKPVQLQIKGCQIGRRVWPSILPPRPIQKLPCHGCKWYV